MSNNELTCKLLNGEDVVHEYNTPALPKTVNSDAWAHPLIAKALEDDIAEMWMNDQLVCGFSLVGWLRGTVAEIEALKEENAALREQLSAATASRR